MLPGAHVVEVGCGTGLLTEVLVGLGFWIDAVDPGANMIEQAKRRVGATDSVSFHVGRFEETQLPKAAYDAVFSATAFHWIDPQVGWAKAATHLKEGGLLVLVTHVAIYDERSAEMWTTFGGLLRTYAPSVKPWSPPRTLDVVLAGANDRKGNASSAWDWLMSEGRHELDT